MLSLNTSLIMVSISESDILYYHGYHLRISDDDQQLSDIQLCKRKLVKNNMKVDEDMEGLFEYFM